VGTSLRPGRSGVEYVQRCCKSSNHGELTNFETTSAYSALAPLIFDSPDCTSSNSELDASRSSPHANPTRKHPKSTSNWIRPFGGNQGGVSGCLGKERQELEVCDGDEGRHRVARKREKSSFVYLRRREEREEVKKGIRGAEGQKSKAKSG